MILAAGKGIRLRPITDATPKILVPVLDLPLLERLVAYLAGSGVSALAMNTHYLAEQAAAHAVALRESHPEWPAIQLFHEPELLGTGGGVANVAHFWGDNPLLVWNGDVVAELDLVELYGKHRSGQGLATLAVQERETDSRLLVDEEGYLCGIDSQRRKDKRVLRAAQGAMRSLAFNGVSVLSASLRAKIARPGPFDLIDALLEVVEAGEAVRTCDVEGNYWGTTGSPDRLAALERELRARPALLARWTPGKAP
ncbi:MAG: NDP-sugar synthase [SAR324 cluster bacterium]|nr:NDP-sugar synthase [SAR324 cluster bacterium]